MLRMEMMEMRWYVLMLAAIVLSGLMLSGCVNPPPQNGTNTTASNQTVFGAQNETATNSSAPKGDPNVAQFGDNASVVYALWVDGKLLDTNNATLANESGIYNPNKKYAPLLIPLELDRGIIKGFVLNVIGMRVNETSRFSVDPARGYGEIDPAKMMTIPRYYEKSLFETIPYSYFTENKINISLGTGFDTKYGTVFVQNISGDNVTLYYMLQAGQNFTVNGIPQTVVNITKNSTATLEFDLGVGDYYQLPDPQTGEKVTYLVANKTDTNITLDGNHPLAGKDLDFLVTLVKIERT
jgi:FKBP-type peptidyl-prolyl cis-trans isomerase 2